MFPPSLMCGHTPIRLGRGFVFTTKFWIAFSCLFCRRLLSFFVFLLSAFIRLQINHLLLVFLFKKASFIRSILSKVPIN